MSAASRSWVKRGLDVALALGLLVLALPVIAVVAVAVRVTLGAPILFRQERPGLGGRPFVLRKFRTMRPEAPGTDHADAARLTRLGRLLRWLSLDELPQLWTVLRGDMSLVGPRPLLLEYLPWYSPEQARRHDARPGITGWAQVHGRNAVGWDERFRLDVWYVDNWSLRLDALILWRTAWVVLSRRGVRQPGHATMPRFTGAPARREETP